MFLEIDADEGKEVDLGIMIATRYKLLMRYLMTNGLCRASFSRRFDLQ